MSNFAINHVAMVVPDIADFLDKSRALYGAFARGPIITNDRQSVREQFVTDGKSTVELLEPMGDRSPIAGFLKRQPHGGLVHVAFDADELEPALAHITSTGGRVVTRPIPDVAFEERRIAFVMVGGQLVELIERRR
jgi:methylmalonyl-CoA/ethylmalonyl-CoA epimerase